MKKLIYLLLIHVYIDALSIEHTPHTYRSIGKQTPNLYSIDLTPAKNTHNTSVTFKQKIALKKKKVEYTLALRY